MYHHHQVLQPTLGDLSQQQQQAKRNNVCAFEYNNHKHSLLHTYWGNDFQSLSPYDGSNCKWIKMWSLLFPCFDRNEAKEKIFFEPWTNLEVRTFWLCFIFKQRTFTTGRRGNPVRLVSGLTGLDSTSYLHTNINNFSSLVEVNSVNMETSRTVILPLCWVFSALSLSLFNGKNFFLGRASNPG